MAGRLEPWCQTTMSWGRACWTSTQPLAPFELDASIQITDPITCDSRSKWSWIVVLWGRAALADAALRFASLPAGQGHSPWPPWPGYACFAPAGSCSVAGLRGLASTFRSCTPLQHELHGLWVLLCILGWHAARCLLVCS